MSEALVKRFADHAWCDAPATPISTTAAQFPTCVTSRMGSTVQANTNIAVLRARVTVRPRRVR